MYIDNDRLILQCSQLTDAQKRDNALAQTSEAAEVTNQVSESLEGAITSTDATTKAALVLSEKLDSKSALEPKTRKS